MIWSLFVILSPCWMKLDLPHLLNRTPIALFNKCFIELSIPGACSCVGAIFGSVIVACLFGYGHHPRTVHLLFKTSSDSERCFFL